MEQGWKEALEGEKSREKAQRQKMQDKKRKSYGAEISADYIEEGYSDEEINDEDDYGNIGKIKAQFGKGKKPFTQRRRSKEEEEEAEQRILKAKEEIPNKRRSKNIVDDFDE